MAYMPFLKSDSSATASTMSFDPPFLPSSLVAKLAVLSPFLAAFYLLYLRYFTGISHIPGPFIASVSNFWKIKAAWQEAMPQQNIELHQKYGPLVRMGPNMISVDDPASMNVIYGFKPIYQKVCLESPLDGIATH